MPGARRYQNLPERIVRQWISRFLQRRPLGVCEGRRGIALHREQCQHCAPACVFGVQLQFAAKFRHRLVRTRRTDVRAIKIMNAARGGVLFDSSLRIRSAFAVSPKIQAQVASAALTIISRRKVPPWSAAVRGGTGLPRLPREATGSRAPSPRSAGANAWSESPVSRSHRLRSASQAAASHRVTNCVKAVSRSE